MFKEDFPNGAKMVLYGLIYQKRGSGRRFSDFIRDQMTSQSKQILSSRQLILTCKSKEVVLHVFLVPGQVFFFHQLQIQSRFGVFPNRQNLKPRQEILCEMWQ